MNNFQFTCHGGPLDGITFKNFANPNPEAHRFQKERVDTEAMLTADSTPLISYLVRGRTRVKVAGRYAVRGEAGNYTANHAPSDLDVYAPTVEEKPDEGN